MKKIFYIPIFLILFSCKNEKTNTEILAKLDNQKFIEIINPIDDIILWNSKTDTININENNEFYFVKEIDKPQFSKIRIGKKTLKSILLPNKQIQISYIDSEYVFQGENKDGMKLLNTFKDPFLTSHEMKKFKNDSTVLQISDKISILKQSELTKLQDLVDSKKISKEFKDILRKEIDYFYALRTLQIIRFNSLQIRFRNNQDFQELIKETLRKYPLKTEYKPNSWLEYANIALITIPFNEKQASGILSRDSVNKLESNDKLHHLKYNLIFEFKDNTIIEKVAADYILKNTIWNKKNKKSPIEVFNDFDKKFPNSIYSKYLTPEIEKLKAFHKKVAGEMFKNVKFLNSNEINNFNDLTKKLIGQKYYIDVWATWCSPCKREFKHNKELNKLLTTKGYKILYLSKDRQSAKKIWKQNIKFYELDGLHLFASQKFQKNYNQNNSLSLGYIPQYLIVDENGKLVTNNAPKPSNLSELEKVL